MNNQEKIRYGSDYVCKFLSSLTFNIKRLEKEFKTKVFHDDEPEQKNGICFSFMTKKQGEVKIYLTGYFLRVIGPRELKWQVIGEDLNGVFSYLIKHLKGSDSQ